MQRTWHPNVVEHRLTHPGTISMFGDFKAAGVAMRQEWIDELARLDDVIADAVVRRRELAAKINVAGRALTGTGRYDRSPERRAWIPQAKPPFIDPVVVTTPASAGGQPTEAAPVLEGRALRDACNAVLRSVAAPLTATDMARLLGAHGHAVKEPHSRSIPNALRPDIRGGRVRRVGRGLYEAAPRDDSSHAA